MAVFSPDRVLYGDTIGFGNWLLGHYHEHQQFVTIGLATAVPRQAIPDYDFLGWNEASDVGRRMWLDTHQKVHEALRFMTGVQGFDLSAVDFDDDVAFGLWMEAHAEEHRLIRRALGLP